MKTREGFFYLLLIVAAVCGLLSLTPRTVSADGGGWPTATPTQTTAPAQVIVQPAVSGDVLVVTPTPTDIQGAAPLPDASTSGDQIQPDNSLLPDNETASSLLQAQSSSGNNFRVILTIGILLFVILIVGFIVFRLRA